MQPRNNKPNNQNRNMMQRHKNRHHNNRNNNQNRGGQQQGPRININQVTNQRDKFLNHARDAQHSGDRVLTEYYLQHADHYQRLINEHNEEQEARRAQFVQQQQDALPEDAAPETPAAGEISDVAMPPRQRQDRRQRQPRERQQQPAESNASETESFSVAVILPPPILRDAPETDPAVVADGE